MPTHKMVVIDGIRYRPEDAPRARTRAPAAQAELFVPSEHTVDEVRSYLEGVDDDERARVLSMEAAGQNRKGITRAGGS